MRRRRGREQVSDEALMNESPSTSGWSRYGVLVTLAFAFFCIFFGPAATQQFLIPIISKRTGLSSSVCSWVLASVYFSALVCRLFCG